MRRPGLFLALLALLVAPPVLADVHPNTAPGFPAEQSFHVGDVDSVNLFNGALTLTIPIGGSYPVNGGFSYSLKLTYNSSPWEFLTIHRVILPFTDVDRIQGIPNRCSNAGLGWRVSLGRMDPPCQVPDSNDTLSGRPIYQDENGTDHIFYPTLHSGDPEDGAVPNVSDVEYTRDGSYLRLKVFNDGHREIGFPDGSVRSFDMTGMPTEIRDAFSNKLMIAYPATTENFEGKNDLVWNLSDSQGRSHKIYFRTDLSPYAQTVDAIVLQAFSGLPAATYHFNYTTPTIGRACPHNDSDPSTTQQVPSSIMVPLLSSVTLPDNSTWSATGYITAQPSGSTWPQNACTENGGNITALTLPTLGSLEWTWQTAYFPTGSSTKKHLQRNSAVATRTMRNANGTVQGTWTYTHAPGFPDADFSKDHTTTVVDSLNHKTVNYFSVALDPSYTGWSQYEYSLPFSRNYPINVPGATLNLSRQIYDGATLLRSEYVLYERDPAFGVVPPDFYNTNRRLLQSRTVYEDDVVNSSTVYGGVTNSVFDGLGHYRNQTTDGNFSGANGRTHFADYNSAQGTYTVNAAANTGSGYNLFPAGSPWVLEAPASMSDSEGGATAQVDLCYYSGSATVTRRRVHRSGAALGAQDLVSVYDVSTQGNVMAEKSYGGDASPQALIISNDLCNLSLPTAPEVQINHTYSSGVRATSYYSGTTFNVLEQTIDPSTGLVSSSKDTAGLQTNYEYDAFGRLTWSEPQGAGNGGWTEYLYTPASGSIKPNVIVRRRDNGSKSATIRAVNTIVFDSFGRLFQEQKTLPDGTTAKRETDYDAVGNKSQVSEWTAGQPGNFTQYLSYDPFGRPGTIQPPDGAAHNVTMTYHGVRQVDRNVNIATGALENPSTTTEIYDRQGRLFSVTEPSGSGGANVTTTYGYDVGNRLASVSTTASVGGTQMTQNRAFYYDSAGLLQSETHPEKGAAGNGSVTYPKYDSRGHVLRKIDGPHDLTFVYDSAERLYQVKESPGTSGRLLKSFTYAPANGTNDWRKGKLQVATRYNYETVSGGPIQVQVDETYTYGGRDGRVSQRDTVVTPTVNGTVQSSHSFTQGFTYTDLGLVNSLSYPLCTHTGCTQSAPAVFGDVAAGAPNQKEIEAIYFYGVTAGCQLSPLWYCPGNAVTRGQMAVFLLIAKEGPGYTPPACVQMFNDVPCTNPQAPFINEIANRGVTGGCGGGNYCPENPVTNAQMAVFLIQMKGISLSACTQLYTDVPCTYWAAAFIAEEGRRQFTSGCGSGNFCPDSVITRGSMASLLARAFDIPVQTDPNTQRTASFLYTQGLLTGVTSGVTTYGTLSYYPNLLVNQVSHGNGVTEAQQNDPNEMRRPLSLSASGAYASWSTGGSYLYDGAGNIKQIGNAKFTYDPVSRLVAASLYDGSTGGGNLKQQSYTFDAFGNITNITGTSGGRNTPTSPQTNRLTGAIAYDAAGNLTNWNLAVYNYDAFNQMTHMTSGAQDWVYLYTADDERIWSYNIPANSSRWTLRDLGGKVLREYLGYSNGRWSVGTDYFYRDGLLLASETQTGQRHYHLDHLGTPRLITRVSGYPAAYHVYYPFGEEATAFNQDTERMKFTAHQRDLASLAGPDDDLDYMHARHESPVTGRFLSADPALESANPKSPQTWNRYNYVAGNPLKYIDPTGEILYFFGTNGDLAKLQQVANDKLHGLDLVIDQQGRASLIPNNETGPASPEAQAFANTLADAISRPQSVNIGVTSGDRGVVFGEYVSGKVDIRDIAAVGSGRGVSGAAILAHEIAEQTARQTMGLSNSSANFAQAHQLGLVAQQAVSGYTFISQTNTLNRSLTGDIVGTHQKGNAVVTVTFKVVNGNISRVTRRP